MTVSIRAFAEPDRSALGLILHTAFSAADTYAVDPSLSPSEAAAWWTVPQKTVFMAVDNDLVLGTYYIRPNAEGPGAHICNCGYVTDPAARGRGVATAMLAHSLDEARRQGYRGMQYNAVVSTNVGAVRLWQKAGFDIVGRVPGAFRHPVEGYVETLIMFKSLGENG